MGNKLCKKRGDTTTTSQQQSTTIDSKSSSSSRFNKIINKFNLKPKWKSDSNLEDKDKVYSYQVNAVNERKSPSSPPSPPTQQQSQTDNASKSGSEWVEIPLSSSTEAPIPPPRKQKRNKLMESVKQVFSPSAATSAAKSSTTKEKEAEEENGEIVEELCVKKTINYDCPCGRQGQHTHENKSDMKKATTMTVGSSEQRRDRKTPSVASLPTYNEYKFSIANGGGGEITPSMLQQQQQQDDGKSSAQSLPDEMKKHSNNNNYNGSKSSIDSYLTRARSFGSLLPTILLHKLQTSTTTTNTVKAPLAEIESDDSLAALDDEWGGLKMIENYTPKDSSLPRPIKNRRNADDILSEIEGMIEIEETATPQPPARKTESLIKRINSKQTTTTNEQQQPRAKSVTPPPSPSSSDEQFNHHHHEEETNEHSNLMKIILQELSTPTTPSINAQPINDFLNAERSAHVSSSSSPPNDIIKNATKTY